MGINWKAVGAGAALTLVAAACSDVASPKRNMAPYALRSVAEADGIRIDYTGQGFTDGVLNLIKCVPPDNGGIGVNLTDNQPYLLWVLSGSGQHSGVTAATLYGVPGGAVEFIDNGVFKAVTTPYYTGDQLVAFGVHAVYNKEGTANELVVSHGCAGGTVHEDAALTVHKDAAGAYDTKYKWTITKDVDKTIVKQVGGNATFNYTVNVSHNDGTISGVKVTGKITVFNSNSAPVAITGVTDKLSDNTVCTVTGGGAQTITGASKDFAYSCDLSAVPGGQLDNTATVTWNEQTLSDQSHLAAGSAPFKVENIAFTGTTTDECVDVKDTFKGTLGTVCVGDANPTTYTYSRTVAVTADQCVNYDNTASFKTNDTYTPGSAGQTVTVCGGVAGGLTMGFWQNKNGQGIITGGAATGGVCNSATWLRLLAPFQDLSASATCAQVGTYVTNVIKAANASGSAMNAMLKAQMLATALDVYFSDTALGGNKISAPAAIGGVKVDLTNICKMIDGSGGVATCSGVYETTSAAFGGATSKTVLELLTYAAGQSNVGGSAWYGQVKATQELAKDTFDAINNGVATVAP